MAWAKPRLRLFGWLERMAAMLRMLVVMLCGVLMVLPALAAPAHEHGVARLDVSLEGGSLLIALDSPLANLLGFEHAPTTEAQRAAVVAMARRLREGAGVLLPNGQARCVLAEVHMASAVLPPAMLGEDSQMPGMSAGHEPAGHADLDASWRFECARPEALRELRVGLFEAFAGFRLIRVQAAGPRGQAYAELSADAPVLAWKQAHD